MKKLIYIGLHEETLPLLYGNFEIAGIAIIDSFNSKTINPINYLFKLIYLLRRNEQLRLIEILLLTFWKILKFFSSSVYYRYRNYLEIISSHKTKLINVKKIDDVIMYIKKKNVDFILVNTWTMLSEKLVKAPKFGTINIHPSKLPQYRGALPTLWTLKNKDKYSAITYMLLNRGMDDGNIISQHIFSVNNTDDWFSLECKATKVIQKTIIATINNYLHGKIKPFPQKNSQNSLTAKYEDYKIIDWEKESAWDLFNKINLYPFIESDEYCYTFYNHKKIIIKRASFNKSSRHISQKCNFIITGFNLIAEKEDGIVIIRLFFDLDFLTSAFLFFNRRSVFKFGK